MIFSKNSFLNLLQHIRKYFYVKIKTYLIEINKKMTFMIKLISHTPWWAFFIFIWLLFIGIKSIKEKEIYSTESLLLTPLTFLIFYIYNLICIHSFKLSFLSVFLCFISLTVTYFSSDDLIKIEDDQKIIKRGSYGTLICGMITFCVRYFCEYKKATSNESFIILELISSAIIGGFSSGKNLKCFAEIKNITKNYAGKN